jgi:predicted lipoprotein with Yx(FWY)xxD motif
MSGFERDARGRTGWVAAIAATAVLLLAAAVGVAAVQHLARPTTVSTHQTKRGKVLAGVNGHSFYMFTRDTSRASACSGTCSKAWPPLLTTGRPAAAAGSGVNAKLLGTMRRSDGRLQVTYNRHPLYSNSADRSAGQINGEGANGYSGHWYLVNTSGNAVKPKSGHPVCNPLCQGY